MALGHWILAASIFIIIIVIALGVGWWARNNSTAQQAALAQGPTRYNTPLGWGPQTPSSNPTANVCLTYDFPTSIIDIGGKNTIVPGNPTFNFDTLSSLTGKKGIPACLDADQILAQQVMHVCVGPPDVLDNSISRCQLINGGTTGLGGVEMYYSNTACPNIPRCAGQASAISLNYQAPNLPFSCINNNGTGANVSMQKCDPSQTSQVFRITRTDPGQNPNSVIPGLAQNGLIAQIYDRNSGLCMVPGTGTVNINFDNASVPGCGSGISPVSGTPVTFGACTGGAFPGYVWAFIPTTLYCENPNGCSGCTGSENCSITPGSNVCFGTPGCTGTVLGIVPPQIAYIPATDFSTFPMGNTGYMGLTGPSAQISWLRDNKAQTLFYGGDSSTPTPILLPGILVNTDTCFELATKAQYLNLTNYNTISSQKVCTIDGVSSTSCVPL